MKTVKALDATALFTRCTFDEFPFETTADLDEVELVAGQARALNSVRFGVGVRGDGFDVFALGPSGLGKFVVINHILAQHAAKRPPPPDWCYINNFEHAHKPKALKLPAGRAVDLQHGMERVIDELRSAIPAAFESEDYQSRIAEVEEELKEKQGSAIGALQERAKEQGIKLFHTPSGFAMAPVKDDDEVVSPQEYEKLPDEEKERVQKVVADLQEDLQSALRQLPGWHKEAREKVRALNQEIASYAVGVSIDPLKAKFPDLPAVLSYLDAVQRDVIEHIDDFRPQTDAPKLPFAQLGAAEPFRRYEVNVLVAHDETQSAPVVFEELPTHGNLIGRAEHQAHMGTLTTDFTLIKAGALHRANGGYLVLDARQLLMQPFAYDGLKRALHSGEIRIESLERMLSTISTVSLEPEAIPLDVKIVLSGERLLYYMLYEHDPEFRDLFKVAADFEETVERNDESNALFARLVGSLAKRKDLRALDRGAVARVIEHGSRLAGDAEKLSTHLRSIGDLLREADYWAGEANRDVIAAEHVQRAIDEQTRRSDRIRERVHENIIRGTVMIDTQGETVGQINGLSVLQIGGFMFGQPSRITATVRLGAGKVVDIERETDLGGPLHSKGVLILGSFLGARYANDTPLSIAASLVFEQSYGGVDGDSASLAELCALLSALSGLPIKQGFAVTGSVNQHGQVQAIGGVNEKIEGFFDICSAGQLTGEQGVLIPASNAKHLMLRHDVVAAAADGRFRVFALHTVDEAIALLTGVDAGERGADGKYPEESVNGRVERRLIELSRARANFAKLGEEPKGGGTNE